MRPLATRVAPAALFLVLAVVLFLPSTLGGKVLSGSDLLLFRAPFATPPGLAQPSNGLLFDAAYVFEPDRLLGRGELRDGRLPLWTRFQGAGRPLLATQQSAPLFPPNWIADVFPFYRSLAWIAVLKLVLAGLGTFLFCRALALARGPSLLAGVSFAFASYLVVWLAHPHSNVYVLLPWLFLATERLCRRRGAADVAGLAAAVGLAQLAGHPESVFIEMVAVTAYAIHRLAGLSEDRLRTVLLYAGGVVLGTAIAAVALLPFGEALLHAFGSRTSAPLPTRGALSLVFPEYWGRPDRYAVPDEPLNFAERTIYLGALPALLALAGLFARRPRGPQLFFAGLGVAGLAVAFNTHFVTDAVRALPVFHDTQLNRSLILVAFAGAALAAFGLDAALRADAAARKRMLAVAAAAVALPVLGFAVTHTGVLGSLGTAIGELPDLDHSPVEGDVVAYTAALRWLVFGAAGLLVLAALLWRPRRAAVLTGLAIGLTALDLLALDAGYQSSIPESHAFPPAPDSVRYLKRHAGHARVSGEFDVLGPNVFEKYGLLDIRGHELPTVERYRKLWAALGGGDSLQRTIWDPGPSTTRKLLDSFGVRYVLSTGLSKNGFPQVFRGRGGIVVENTTALPRAWIAHGWRPSKSLGNSLGLVRTSTSKQEQRSPAIEDAPAPRAAAGAPTPVRLVSESNTSVRLAYRSPRAGQLVLLDTYYPGWKAYVDGHETKIRPANGAFRAIAVPAGRHEVRFRYRPASVFAGAGLSVAALLVLAGLLALSFRRKRYGQRP